jgi:hypothetical protein
VQWLTFRFGWRTAFIATGSLGLLWIAAWVMFYQLPEKSSISAAELAYIRSDPEDAAKPIPLRTLLTLNQAWALASVVGFATMAGTNAGMLIAKAVGYILQSTGSYVPVFVLAGLAYLVALAFAQALAPRLEPVQSDLQAQSVRSPACRRRLGPSSLL